MVLQFIGVVNSGKDSVLGQRPDAAGDKMDVDVAASSSMSEGKTYSIGTSALCFRKDGMEIENPIEDGLGTYLQPGLYAFVLTSTWFSEKLGYYRKIVGPCFQGSASHQLRRASNAFGGKMSMWPRIRIFRLMTLISYQNTFMSLFRIEQQEPSYNSNACREKLVEIMFEKYKVGPCSLPTQRE